MRKRQRLIGINHAGFTGLKEAAARHNRFQVPPITGLNIDNLETLQVLGALALTNGFVGGSGTLQAEGPISTANTMEAVTRSPKRHEVPGIEAFIFVRFSGSCLFQQLLERLS